MLKILVIGEDARSFLSIVRSLGRCGHEIHAAPHDSGTVALRSKYIRETHILEPAALNIEKWLASLEALQNEWDFDLIIPCDDRSLVPLMKLPHGLDMSRIANPGKKAFDVFYDKWKTREAAVEQDIPISAGAEAVADNVAAVGLPLMLKPKVSVRTDIVGQRQTVRPLSDMKQALAALERVERPEDYFLEGFFDGVGIGVSVLCNDGEVVCAFQHERMLEGIAGGSSLRVSAALHPGMREAAVKLAKHTGLTGVAMFEFRYNREEDRFVLLEVNARFWGSLPLAIYAGVDFPAMLVNSMSTGRFAECNSYRYGLVGRALTASLYDFARELSSAEGGTGKLSQLGAALPALWRMCILRERVDSFAFDDPAPFLGEIGDIAGLILSPIGKRLGFDYLSVHARASAERRSLAQKNADPHDILVLCYGNICRSPFAEACLRKQLDGKNIQITSAGFHPVVSRPSPDIARRCAAKFGLSLDTHASQVVTSEMIDNANLIILFDDKNKRAIKQYFPNAEDKVLNLGSLARPYKEIEDPFGKDDAVFTACYQRIVEGCEALAARLEKVAARRST